MSYPCPFKFRAFDGRKMVPVHSICFNDGGALWYSHGNQFGWAWINPNCTSWNEANPKPGEADVCPVMRWTGLVDREGKEIWEDDIIRCWDERSLYVVRYMRGGFSPTHFLYDTSIIQDGWGLQTCGTVVGDIHTSPSLLKSVKVTTEEAIRKMASMLR